MDHLISTLLIFPKIVPTDWDQWWEVWNKNSTIIKKNVKNHNADQALWTGFNIYVKPGIDPVALTGYIAPFIDCTDLFPALFNNISNLPVDVKVIRAVSSYGEINPHTDFTSPRISVRTMLYDSNPTQTFYYFIDHKKIYQDIPEDTNTWCYWDHKFKHGTDYDKNYYKILLMYFGDTKENFDLTPSLQKYSSSVIQHVPNS
jgi:hypothetical protein